MKHTKRLLAVLLAAALFTGLLPAAALTAQAADAATELTAADARSTVMLDASGLRKADTVILGHAENSGSYYPLEWQIGDDKPDEDYKDGRRLLISKYLLPAATTDAATGGIDTAASYGAVSMADGTTTALHMPDSTAVLPTYKADADYIANIGSNLSKYTLWYPADVNAGLSVRGDDASMNRRALEGALFFDLSAKEAEGCIVNSIDNLDPDNTSTLLRRPYAAGFAVSDAGDRSWALRGQTLKGAALAMRKGSSDYYYVNSSEGLVQEAGEDTLSRPAFHLRTNAVSFWYSVDVGHDPNGANTTVTPKETAVEFGADDKMTPVSEQSGAMNWRAALETLPMTYASATYRDDGTVELDFYNDGRGHKIGVLTADADGNVLSYGTVRNDTQGGHAFYKPGKDESKLYFFLYDYGAKTHQLYTSNLIEVSAQRASAMMLGAGVLKSGDNVIMNDYPMPVLNADTGIEGMKNTGSTCSLTESNNGYDDPPVLANNAMLLLADTGKRVSYDNSEVAQTVAVSLPFLSSTRYNDGYAQELARTQASINAAAEAGTTAAKAANQAILANQADYFESAFDETYKADSPLSKAIPYTWLSSDKSYSVKTFTNDSSPEADSATVNDTDKGVSGKQLFFLSAGEFAALPTIHAQIAVGTSLLRSSVTETFNIPATSDKLTLTSDPAATYSAKAATLNAFYSGTDIPEKAAFHLRKDRVVYAFQPSAIDRTVTAANDLHPVGTYASTCKDWEIAVLDDTIVQPFAYPVPGSSPNQAATFSVMNMPNGRANSWAVLLVTDRAGTVKQYGRISSLASSSLNEFTIDTDDFDYGDRLYLVYEYETGHAAQPVVYTSDPVVIWEKKLDGTVAIDPSPYKPGETLYADLSDVRYAPGTEFGFEWYCFEQRNIALGTAQTYTVSGSLPSMDVFVYDGRDSVNRLTASAELVAELPVYPGEKEPDFFKGGTLYYGADSDANKADYAWTVVGRPTDGITEATDASRIPLYEAANLNNAVELLRKTATPQSGTDTVLRGYMETGVLLTDIRDEAITGKLKADAYSADDQTVFRMSHADYIALNNYPAARFAAAQNSSWGREYVLRNHKGNKYLTVNPLLNLQSAALGADACTREAINLNNQTVVFYSPADCELTYSALLKCRQTPQGEWKATVSQPALFDDFRIEHVQNGFANMTLYGSFDQSMEGRYITAWGVKDGKIVWIDSKACEGTEFSLNFDWDQSLDFDELYFVARKDNGHFRSDVCSAVYSAYPTDIQVQFFLDGEETGYDHYDLKDAQDNEQTTFASGEQVKFHAFSVDAIYIQKVEVLFSDGTKQTAADLNRQSYDTTFTVKGVQPTIRVYLETGMRSVSIDYMIEPYFEDGGNFPEDAVTLTYPEECRYGKSYDFTVDLLPGFYISNIYSMMDGYELPNTNPITVVVDGETRTGYAPGTYSRYVDDYGDWLMIEVKELPFSLQLVSDPKEGGVVTAKLPENRSLSTLTAGDEVTVYATPNEGYVLRGFTLKTQNGEQELTLDGDHAAFTMPNENAIVTAQFARLNTVTVKLFKDGKQVDTGASWTLKDKNGTGCSIFADGEKAYISAIADTGLAISHITVTYSDGTSIGEGSLESIQDFVFTVRDTDPVVGIYLTKAQVPVTIEAQTVDSKGNVLEEQGGAVYAPTYISYGDSFTYNASAYKGYFISAITCNEEAAPNTRPEKHTSGGKTVIGYGAEAYTATADSEDVYILVQFTKLDAGHSITSVFADVSGATPAAANATVTYTVDGKETDVFYAGDEVTATVTCKDNLAVASTEATPETALTQTDRYTFTFTMPDEDLAITYNMKKLAIRSAYLHINEDINLIYAVQVPEGFEEAAASFDFLGETYTAETYKVDENGRYCFEFTHINPQLMGEPVDVTVTAKMNGYTFSHTNTGYSVRTYCVSMLSKTDDPLLRTLLSDVLTYGAAAQKYKNYKTDALVTDGVSIDPSTYPGLSGLKYRFVGTADPDTAWTSASLRLSNSMCMDFCFTASDLTDLSVNVTVDGRTQNFTEFEKLDNGRYRVTFEGIYATEFGATVSAEFLRGGEKIGNTLKYSVNTYICGAQDSEDTALADLVKAVYNYGVSALTYYNERILKK